MANISQMLSAGVYPNEVDNSNYTSATTSNITGIVGKAKKGPTEVIYLTDREQILKELGTPDPDSYGIHAALLVVKAGGAVAFKRVVHLGEKAKSSEGDVFVFSSKLSGEEGNKITVQVTEPSDDKFDLTISYNGVVVEQYSNLVLNTEDIDSVDATINGQSAYVSIKVNPHSSVEAKTYTLTGGTDEVAFATGGNKESDCFIAKSKTYDSTINGAFVNISKRDEFGTRTYKLVQGSKELEIFSSLSEDPSSERFISRFITKYSDYISVDFVEANKEVLANGDAISIKLANGKDGSANIDQYDVVQAMQDFSDNEAIKIRTLIAPGYTDYYVIKSGMDIAESRHDCNFPFDGEEDFTPQQILNWSNGVGKLHEAYNSSFGALYYPWIKIYDEFTKQEIFQPTAGFVAAQYVINDTKGDVYEAPAGLERGVIPGAISLKYECNKVTRDLLYGNRNIVNPIAKFINHGIVIWGQKTCQRTPSVFDRVNNRRLANYLMSTIVESTMNLVFEGNHSITWDKWKSRVEPILDRLKSRNGIVDYRLVMDQDNITMNEIENHIMPGKVLIKYGNTAEFIPLDFVAYNTSHVFQDE